MNITIRQDALLKALQIIHGVVEKKQTRPILSHALLTATEDQLLLTATDSEIELISAAPLETMTSPGSITAPARKLYDICRTLPERSLVRISLDKSRLIVQSGPSHFSLGTLAAQDFPTMEGKFLTDPELISFSIPAAAFRRLLSKTSFAMGQEDVRHYLNGTAFSLSSGKIECMTTDGHRFAFSKMEDAAIPDQSLKVLVPRKSVLEVLRLLNPEDAAATARFCLNGHYLRIMTDDFTFTSKLVHTPLPDYHRLIPERAAHTVLANRELLRQALTRVSILAHEKFRNVVLELSDDQLYLSTQNPEREEAKEAMPLEYQGPSVDVSFNVLYLSDAISAIDSEYVRWSFSNLENGILIESDDGARSCLYVVMPLFLPKVEQANVAAVEVDV